MTACSGVAMPMHALRETCTRMGLRYQIGRGVMGGVHVDLISCNFAKPAQAGCYVHMRVLKSSSTGKDRTANAAEHLLVIDIEAKSNTDRNAPRWGRRARCGK